MWLEFVYNEPYVKPEVREIRNDPLTRAAQTSRMAKKHKKIRKVKTRPDGGPLWYVKEWLVHLNLQQKDLITRTGKNKGEVSEWVNCWTRFNADTLYSFADALGVEAADLLRPPSIRTDNELARYVVAMDAKQRERALKILQAADLLPGERAA